LGVRSLTPKPAAHTIKIQQASVVFARSEIENYPEFQKLAAAYGLINYFFQTILKFYVKCVVD